MNWLGFWVTFAVCQAIVAIIKARAGLPFAFNIVGVCIGLAGVGVTIWGRRSRRTRP